MVLVDTNVLLDVVTENATWSQWSQGQLESLAISTSLFVNPIVYAEMSVAYRRIEELDTVLQAAELKLVEIPRAALFLAGKVFVKYRRKRGTRTGVLPDFFIGAHAAVAGWSILTRDVTRYRNYFPTVDLIAPN